MLRGFLGDAGLPSNAKAGTSRGLMLAVMVHPSKSAELPRGAEGMSVKTL
jgi:hypothetical protein